MTAHVVFDGDRELAFEGVALGEASSHERGKGRWTEIAIYRVLPEGTYVVAGAGRSLLAGEVDFRWARACAAAGDVLDRLYRVDGKGIEYIPNVSMRALMSAVELDEPLRRAHEMGRRAHRMGARSVS